jgi:hypothetical protein
VLDKLIRTENTPKISTDFFHRRKHPKGEATKPKKPVSQQSSSIPGPY